VVIEDVLLVVEGDGFSGQSGPLRGDDKGADGNYQDYG